MQLKIQHLQKVVQNTLSEQKAVEALRGEVRRCLGPIMDTDVKLVALAEAVNDRVQVLSWTGRRSQAFKPSVVVPFIGHSNHEVRTMSANVLPEHFLDKLKFDPHSAVRAAVARRTDMQTVKEMMRRFPRDDELRTIYKQRRKQLNEDGLPKPTIEDEPFDMYGEERLGDAAKQPDGPELSDEWYESQAFKLCQMYDNNLERSWEEKSVANLCRAVKATSGVEIDHDKLLKKVMEQLEDRDDRAMERDSLKELASSLRHDAELLEEAIEFAEDPVTSLIESQLTPGDFVERANSLFKVREAIVPGAIKKFRMGTTLKEQMVPVKATLPHASAPRAIDERALDLYVKHWNSHQAMQGEPLEIKWSSHPESANVISFSTVLK